MLYMSRKISLIQKSSSENGCRQCMWWILFVTGSHAFALLSRRLFCAGIDECSGALKLQKGREKDNKEMRKEKKREKKGKEKQQKSREEHGNSKHSHKKRKHDERSKLHEKDGNHKKVRKEVSEKLEKSSLTEEHELQSLIQKPCKSSDSTQNSSKSRKPVDTDPSHKSTGGTIIRIKLPLLKHRDPELLATNEDPCFSGRIPEAPIEPEPAAETAHRQLSSERSSCCSSSISEEERQFRDLLVNWKSTPLYLEECSDIGDEWLYGTGQQHGYAGAMRCGVSCSCCSEDLGHERSMSSLQPRACYLPEFDMYQHPYVIPF